MAAMLYKAFLLKVFGVHWEIFGTLNQHKSQPGLCRCLTGLLHASPSPCFKSSANLPTYLSWEKLLV